MPTRKTISLVIPVYNEEENLKPLYQKITNVWKEELADNYQPEIVFVDDGSSDRSGEIIHGWAQQDQRVKFIQFSRNFGKEAATSAGLHHASGDAAMIMDADLQHPPELIPEFIQKWEEGAEVVVGLRQNHVSTRSPRNIGARAYYFLMRRFGDPNIQLNSSDYRLLDQRVVDEFNYLTERNRLTRGLIDWLGFQRETVPFKVASREKGNSNYTLWQLVGLSFHGIVGHSLIPLRLAGLLGVGITAFASLLGIALITNQYFLNDPLNFNITSSGFLALFTLFLVGVILISQGLLALYIANIHREIANRPLYVIRDKKNLP